jgi:hypothetical protein
MGVVPDGGKYFDAEDLVELPQSFTSREFLSNGRIRLMSRQMLRQLAASWKPRSEARCRKSSWSARREPMRCLVTATTAPKGQAEALVRTSGLNYTVLRAPLLLGPGTEGAAALGET